MENTKLDCKARGEFCSVKRIGEPMLVSPAEETKKGRYFLSNLDFNHMNAIQSTYSFGSDKDGKEKLRYPAEVIRTSLEKVLVYYYPLAGRLILSPEGRIMVDCNGRGAVFVVAEADCVLEEIRDTPETHEKLLYNVPGLNNGFEMPPLVVQVTQFNCGGFVLGLSILHCMVDGTGTREFVNSWGEIARGLNLTTPPFLDRTILRSRDPPRIEYGHHEFMEIEDYKSSQENEEILLRSFCFGPAKLEKLKAKATDGTLGKCTTFEALAGFVWQARTKALNFPPENKAKLLIPVSGRTKLVPPLPKGYFGNGIVLAHSICPAQELLTRPLSHAVGLVQAANGMVTDGYIRSGIDYFEVTRPQLSLAGTVVISSLSKLPSDGADFGWGSPVDRNLVDLHKEVVYFRPDRKEPKSINVVLRLPVRAMERFEQLNGFLESKI